HCPGPIARLCVNESMSAPSVNPSRLRSLSPNEPQPLTVTASPCTTRFRSNPAVTYSNPNSTGTLSLTPAVNAFGSATISVTVNYGGASNNTEARPFTVTVNAVNCVTTP